MVPSLCRGRGGTVPPLSPPEAEPEDAEDDRAHPSDDASDNDHYLRMLDGATGALVGVRAIACACLSCATPRSRELCKLHQSGMVDALIIQF